MSFIYMDASNGNVLDILQDRRLSFLKSYFFQFPLDVREQVETVYIDMYEAYIQLNRSCFPNAKISTDRFHIVQHINSALNPVRIHVTKHNPKYYARLERYWKLILKDASSLDNHRYCPI